MNGSMVAVILAIYALMLIAGGAMGYVRAGSRASLIAGLVSGVIGLIAAVLAAAVKYQWGVELGLCLAAVILLFFGPRFLISKKFMPAGLMSLLSIIVTSAMTWALVT